MFKMFKTSRSASKKKFTCSLTNRTITTTVTQRQQQQKKHNNITQLQLSAGRLSGFYTNPLFSLCIRTCMSASGCLLCTRTCAHDIVNCNALYYTWIARKYSMKFILNAINHKRKRYDYTECASDGAFKASAICKYIAACARLCSDVYR